MPFGISEALIPSLIGAGSSLLGGIFGSNASNKAAKQSVEGQQHAIQTLQAQEGDNYSFANNQMGRLQPYVGIGAQGLGGLQSGFAPGGQFTQQMSPDEILKQDPGYNFQLSQGSQAIQRAGAASGTGLSGGEAKDLTTYSQQLAQNAYQQAFSNYNQTQNQNFSRLMGLTGIGQQAVGGQNQAEQNAQGLNANLAGQVANTYSGIGATQAAGTLGAASSINQALGGIANSGMGYASLSGLGIGSGMNAGGFGMATPNMGMPSGIMGTGINTTALPPSSSDFVGLGQSSLAGAPSTPSTPFGQ